MRSASQIWLTHPDGLTSTTGEFKFGLAVTHDPKEAMLEHSPILSIQQVNAE